MEQELDAPARLPALAPILVVVILGIPCALVSELFGPFVVAVMAVLVWSVIVRSSVTHWLPQRRFAPAGIAFAAWVVLAWFALASASSAAGRFCPNEDPGQPHRAALVMSVTGVAIALVNATLVQLSRSKWRAFYHLSWLVLTPVWAYFSFASLWNDCS